jgi:hypothetical protein
MKSLPALRDQDPKTILARYLSDESTKDIAADYGVTRQALGKYLLAVAEDEWKQAQVARAIARKEQAEDDLENIRDQISTAADDLSIKRLTLTVSHARERLKSAQWDLERVCRRIYGQDSPTAAQAVQININLRRDHSVPVDVIEVEKDK